MLLGGEGTERAVVMGSTMTANMSAKRPRALTAKTVQLAKIINDPIHPAHEAFGRTLREYAKREPAMVRAMDVILAMPGEPTRHPEGDVMLGHLAAAFGW